MTKTTKYKTADIRLLVKKIFDECISCSFSYEELSLNEKAAISLVQELVKTGGANVRI